MSKSGIQVGYADFPRRGTTYHFYKPGEDGIEKLIPDVQVYFSEKLKKVRIFVGDKEWSEDTNE